VSVYPDDISETNSARITKRDTEMFRDDSWKSIYFGVKRSKVQVVSDKNIAGVSAGCVYLLHC